MEVFKGWLVDRPDKFTGIVERPDGDKFWCLNGGWHRVDGPAIEWFDGATYWFLNGVYMTEEEHYKRTAYLRTTLGKLIFKEQSKLI
jgi:hypothetical protein